MNNEWKKSVRVTTRELTRRFSEETLLPTWFIQFPEMRAYLLGFMRINSFNRIGKRPDDFN